MNKDYCFELLQNLLSARAVSHPVKEERKHDREEQADLTTVWPYDAKNRAFAAKCNDGEDAAIFLDPMAMEEVSPGCITGPEGLGGFVGQRIDVLYLLAHKTMEAYHIKISFSGHKIEKLEMGSAFALLKAGGQKARFKDLPGEIWGRVASEALLEGGAQ